VKELVKRKRTRRKWRRKEFPSIGIISRGQGYSGKENWITPGTLEHKDRSYHIQELLPEYHLQEWGFYQ